VFIAIDCITNFFTVFLDLKNNQSLRHKLYSYFGENETIGLQHFSYNNPVFTDNIFGHLSLTDYKGIVVRFKT